MGLKSFLKEKLNYYQNFNWNQFKEQVELIRHLSINEDEKTISKLINPTCRRTICYHQGSINYAYSTFGDVVIEHMSNRKVAYKAIILGPKQKVCYKVIVTDSMVEVSSDVSKSNHFTQSEIEKHSEEATQLLKDLKDHLLSKQVMI